MRALKRLAWQASATAIVTAVALLLPPEIAVGQGLPVPDPILARQAEPLLDSSWVNLRHNSRVRTSVERGRTISEARSGAPDHRWTGLAIGAGVGAIVFGVIGHGTCDDGGSCLGPTLGIGLLGALAGGVSGGLIGSLFPKHEQHSSTEFVE